MYGLNKEYMAYPIIELIRRELKNAINSGALTESGISGNRAGDTTINEGGTTVEYSESLLDLLNSNDYVLTLEKNDPTYPNRLTGAVIVYGETLKLLISLIREGSKLKYVKLNLLLTELVEDLLPNPYNMSKEHFYQYMKNKNLWNMSSEIIADPSSTQQEIDDATVNKNLAEVRNTQLRNLYGVSHDQDKTYGELAPYMYNWFAMTSEEYLEYAKNKYIPISGHINLTQQVIDDANQRAAEIRLEHNIVSKIEYPNPVSTEVDLPYYADPAYSSSIWVSLTNPFNMTTVDFETYYALRVEEIDATPARVIDIEAEKQALLDSYYITVDNYTLSELEAYIGTDSTGETQETLLLKILISLFYTTEGKLFKVVSETLSS